jgi:putative membrane protein
MMWYGWGGWWMGLSMVLFWGGIIALIVWGLRSVDPGRRDDDRRPRRILEERLARGEIDREEFDERLQALRGG